MAVLWSCAMIHEGAIAVGASPTPDAAVLLMSMHIGRRAPDLLYMFMLWVRQPVYCYAWLWGLSLCHHEAG